MNVLLIALGAAIGAPLRFIVDKLLVARLLRATGDRVPLPWGTFAAPAEIAGDLRALVS